jgi:hypothetical protein
VGGSIENAMRAGSKVSPQNLVSRYVSSDQSARSVVVAKPWDRPRGLPDSDARRISTLSVVRETFSFGTSEYPISEG